MNSQITGWLFIWMPPRTPRRTLGVADDDCAPAPHELFVLFRHHFFERDAQRVQRWLVHRTGRQHGAQPLAPSLDPQLQDVFLGGEVAVEGSYRDLRLGRDLLDGHVVPAALEELQGDRLQVREHRLGVLCPQLSGKRFGRQLRPPSVRASAQPRR